MKETQRERIERYLREHGSIEMPDALNMYPAITRLGSIIHRMKGDGWLIHSERVEGKTWQRYTLIAEPGEQPSMEKMLTAHG